MDTRRLAALEKFGAAFVGEFGSNPSNVVAPFSNNPIEDYTRCSMPN